MFDLFYRTKRTDVDIAESNLSQSKQELARVEEMHQQDPHNTGIGSVVKYYDRVRSDYRALAEAKAQADKKRL